MTNVYINSVIFSVQILNGDCILVKAPGGIDTNAQDNQIKPNPITFTEAHSNNVSTSSSSTYTELSFVA
ncbi:unnamed protein product [Dovyalis caffra]|uniref:Uncharacterized protein n=1 Tax=Dovyalis caffra TaxID=77055 RepID=A0AAV1RD35_9ROSI|nr:unnamed protein product [Dovyalis caffra]